MPMPRGHKVDKTKKAPEDIPLTGKEKKFVAEYLKTNNATKAWKSLGWDKGLSEHMTRQKAQRMLQKPNVKMEILRIMDKLENEAIANGAEVMSYFTSVMRGEIKDQFGLDAPLSERTKAAQELAKRTVDIENRKAGEPDQLVAIKLDWSRDTEGSNENTNE